MELYKSKDTDLIYTSKPFIITHLFITARWRIFIFYHSLFIYYLSKNLSENHLKLIAETYSLAKMVIMQKK